MKQIADTIDGVVGDALQNSLQVKLRIEAVEPG